MADEEIIEEGGEATVPEAEEGMRGSAYVPQAPSRPRSDIYTLLLILTFVAFLTGTIFAGRECWDFYDVQFFVFGK